MNIEQLIDSKSKQEVAFMIYSQCIFCHHFCEDQYGSWKCESSWNEEWCRKDYENFLVKILDKNTYK